MSEGRRFGAPSVVLFVCPYVIRGLRPTRPARSYRQVHPNGIFGRPHRRRVAVIGDRQVWHDLVELPAVRRIVRERPPHVLGERAEVLGRLRSKPQNLVAEPAALRESEVEGRNFAEDRPELPKKFGVGVRGRNERKQDGDVRRHAIACDRIQSMPMAADDRLGFGDRHDECGPASDHDRRVSRLARLGVGRWEAPVQPNRS